MKSTTVRFIIILVAMLFLNIEAAHAGLVQRFRVFILHEFPDYEWLYICLILSILSLLAYIVFTPVAIGKEKWAWLNYPDYGTKKETISRISHILNSTEKANTAHK